MIMHAKLAPRREMSEDIEDWIDWQRCRFQGRQPAPVLTVNVTSPEVKQVPPCPLTDAELDWLWPRYQRCSFPPASFPKSFAKTPREKLTPRGKNAAVRCAYKYRRQIFGKAASKWGEALFLGAVRAAISRAGGPEHAKGDERPGHTNQEAAASVHTGAAAIPV